MSSYSQPPGVLRGKQTINYNCSDAATVSGRPPCGKEDGYRQTVNLNLRLPPQKVSSRILIHAILRRDGDTHIDLYAVDDATGEEYHIISATKK